MTISGKNWKNPVSSGPNRSNLVIDAVSVLLCSCINVMLMYIECVRESHQAALFSVIVLGSYIAPFHKERVHHFYHICVVCIEIEPGER